MPIAPRIAALLLAVASVAVLGGCTGGTPVVSASPSPSATPVFTTEEDALAAAEATYTAYLATSDLITTDHGNGSDRIEPFVTGDYLPTELAGFAEYAADGSYTQGISKFDSLHIQQLAPDLIAGDFFTTYLCADTSEVRILSSDGTDITPATRLSRIPLEVDFTVAASNPVSLLISRSEVWSGDDFC